MISDDPLNHHLPPLDEVLLSELEHCACCHDLKDHCRLSEDHECVNWIEKTPDEPSEPLPKLIEQSDSNSETSNCSPQVFVPEGGNGAAKSNEDDDSIIPIFVPKWSLFNIHFIDFDDTSIVSDNSSVADFHNPDEPDPDHLCQNKQPCE